MQRPDGQSSFQKHRLDAARELSGFADGLSAARRTFRLDGRRADLCVLRHAERGCGSVLHQVAARGDGITTSERNLSGLLPVSIRTRMGFWHGVVRRTRDLSLDRLAGL